MSKEQLVEIIKALQAEIAKSSISKRYDNNLEKTAAMTTDSNIEDYFAQLRATDELAFLLIQTEPVVRAKQIKNYLEGEKKEGNKV